MIIFNKVTWYSRLLAIIFFIGVLPTLTFYLGTKYFDIINNQKMITIDRRPPLGQSSKEKWVVYKDFESGVSFEYPKIIEQSDIEKFNFPDGSGEKGFYDIDLSFSTSTSLVLDVPKSSCQGSLECQTNLEHFRKIMIGEIEAYDSVYFTIGGGGYSREITFIKPGRQEGVYEHVLLKLFDTELNSNKSTSDTDYLVSTIKIISE